MPIVFTGVTDFTIDLVSTLYNMAAFMTLFARRDYFMKLIPIIESIPSGQLEDHAETQITIDILEFRISIHLFSFLKCFGY